MHAVNYIIRTLDLDNKTNGLHWRDLGKMSANISDRNSSPITLFLISKPSSGEGASLFSDTIAGSETISARQLLGREREREGLRGGRGYQYPGVIRKWTEGQWSVYWFLSCKMIPIMDMIPHKECSHIDSSFKPFHSKGQFTPDTWAEHFWSTVVNILEGKSGLEPHTQLKWQRPSSRSGKNRQVSLVFNTIHAPHRV